MRIYINIYDLELLKKLYKEKFLKTLQIHQNEILKYVQVTYKNA